MIELSRSQNVKFKQFLQSVRVSGYATYSHYLNSDEWKNALVWYRECGLPTKCMVCGHSNPEYHHWTYRPITEFLPTDIIPLCRLHHETIHQHYEIGDEDIEQILFRAFGISGNAAMKLHWRAKKKLNRLRHRPSTAERPCVKNVRVARKSKKKVVSAYDRYELELAALPEESKSGLTFQEIKERNKMIKINRKG
jgi:hypothetical protein